ncbi:MAG: D-alanine--poly(phosphoribitol) ligase subunit 2, partial [Eubacterium sp.]|nr:D-alanine--poly(phosphoribitol) ligase subunit 2 [Eubacterium sp.]
MEERLLEILSNICGEELGKEDVDLDLIEEGFLDSLAFVELTVALEDEFHVSLPPTEYEKESLATIRKIEKILSE